MQKQISHGVSAKLLLIPRTSCMSFYSVFKVRLTYRSDKQHISLLLSVICACPERHAFISHVHKMPANNNPPIYLGMYFSNPNPRHSDMRQAPPVPVPASWDISVFSIHQIFGHILQHLLDIQARCLSHPEDKQGRPGLSYLLHLVFLGFLDTRLSPQIADMP